MLEYLNEGYEWVIDFDIEKYFDTVNHDKLISILREQVNDSTTLHLIRSFLQAGVMEEGLVHTTDQGVSPVLSNIYLDKLDKELESRGLRFVRYADDFVVFVVLLRLNEENHWFDKHELIFSPVPHTGKIAQQYTKPA